MKKELKTIIKVEIAFENGEVATVKADDIGVIEISGVSDKIVRTPNAINEMTVAENVLIEFKPEANTEYAGFGKDAAFKAYLFERITEFSDIANIEVFYDDDTSKLIFVTYKELNPGMIGSNAYQMNYVNGDKLMVVISRDRTFATADVNYFRAG